jgi:immune inhibitor A
VITLNIKEKRRMKKIVSMVILICLAVSIIAVAFPANASTELVDDAKGIDVNTSTKKWIMNEPIEPPSHHSYWNVGDSAIWSYYDDFYGGIVFTYFTLKYNDSNVEIWQQNNLNWGRPSAWTGTFPYPPEWRTNPPKGPTYLQYQYLASEWGNKILPNETAFFGAPALHDGTNAQADDIFGLPSDYYYYQGGRQVLLVCNIRDENYYLPNYGGPGIAYPYKIIGVHIGEYEDVYYDRNVVTIDAISFDRQLGPPGYTWPGAAGPVTAPYAYESTVAHEYQHLLHHELCPGDATFMNEGCSMYAEFLVGYGIDPDYPNSYFATPDNSLTEWGDQGAINILADYGAAALWTMYLNDQFGSSFLQYYFNSGGGGVNGINAVLAHFKYKDRFDDVYRDWKLANLIRADFPGCHKYNYKSLNLNDPAYIPVRQYQKTGVPVPVTKGTDFGNTVTILGYDTGVSMVATYGNDYITFEDWSRPGFIYFDGDDTATVPLPHLWTLTADGWYSGTGVNSADEFIAGDATVNPANPTMTLVTAYAFEEYWDFGFVQVSTDGGNTWTSLENGYTTYDHNPSARPSIVANLPGFTGFSPEFPGWTTMTFDLSAYAGQTVKIGFHYMTDDLYTEAGWLINSATVSGTEVSLAPFVFFPKVDFQVTVVSALVICGKTLYIPWDMWLTEDTNKGMGVGFAKKPSYVVLVVTPIMQKGMADYQFQVTTKPIFKFC